MFARAASVRQCHAGREAGGSRYATWAAHRSSVNTPAQRSLSTTPAVVATSLRRVVSKCDAGGSGGVPEPNPLHQLRVTTDPSQRAALLQQLDNCWSDAADAYVPSPVEQYLLEALPGLSQHAVMMLAVQKPGLVSHDVDECVRPVIRALKDARILSLDISFLLGKRPELLGRPLPLQRWLDFLSVYGLGPKDTLNFLLRGSSRLLDEVTLFQAGAVVTFLKQLGIKDEYLASRVVCIWPDVLGRDVEAELRPVVVALMRLGMELPDVARIVSLWPEVLLASPETTITPFVQYLTAAGCEATQIAAVLGDTPHLLGFPPADVFGPRLAALAGVGIGQEQLAAMMSKSTRPLTARGGVVEQLAWLRAALGLNDEQIKAVVMAQPDILAEKVADLEAKWRFITGRVEGRVSDVLRHPLLLAAPLPTVLGPRWDFAVSKSALPAVSGLEGYDFDALLGCSDLELCETLRCSANEYGGYKARWEESHSESVHADNAAEFQAELKKLGIFEGPPSS